MDIQLVDVTIHIDQALDAGQRSEMDTKLRGIDGVVSVHNPDDKPHLMVVEYRPDKVDSQQLLQCVRDQNVQAELIGL